MDLKEFVSSSLIQIVEGVLSARETIGSRAVLVPALRWKSEQTLTLDESIQAERVEFDVAVTVEAETGGKADGRIKVLGIGIGAGLEASHLRQNSTASRVQFGLTIGLPQSRGSAEGGDTAPPRRRSSAPPTMGP